MPYVLRYRDPETGGFIPQHEAKETCPTCWGQQVVKETDGYNSWCIECEECGGLGYVSELAGKHIFQAAIDDPPLLP